MTLLAVKTEADDAEPVVGTAEPVVGTAEPVAGTAEPVAGTAEPVAGTSAEHVNAQPRAEDWGASRPTSDDELIFALCASDSGEEAMSDDWVETIEGRSALKTLKSREGVGPCSSSNDPSQPLHPKPPKQSHSPPSSNSSSQAEKKIFTCKVCGKSCTHKGHLNYHMRSHTGEKPFACAVCGKSFGQRCHLRDHMSKHTGEKPFACKACGKGWSKKWFLKYHTCTGISPIPHIKEEPEDLFQRAPVEEEAPVEDSTTTSLAVVKVEGDDDETGESDRRSPLVSSRPAKTQDVIAQVRGTSRPTGGDNDDDLLLLTWHGSETGGEEGYNEWRRCETSGFLTALSPSNSHKRPTHWDANFLQATHSAMMTMSHAGERSFMCTVCGKNCSHQGHLNYHMNTHTGQKPFTCTLCGKGFAQKGNLKEHMVKHTNIKPFSCKVCGKGCSRKADLKVHMMIHTGEKPFICTVCGKGCSHRGHLNYHMRSHTGEKPFTCPVCGRGFIQRSNMKVHMVKHTRERLLQGSRPELSLIGDAPVSNSSSM